MMINFVRKKTIERLWQIYKNQTQQMLCIEKNLANMGISSSPLDHFAIIDLPGPNTGIPILQELFSLLGYQIQGKDYLACKQNDFAWLTEADSFLKKPHEVLPQIVVADFRLDEMPVEIRKIISKYSAQSKAPPTSNIKKLLSDEKNVPTVLQILTDYLRGRDWGKPSVYEFKAVQEFNELLAWVLVYGRKPNHFTLSIHLIEQFQSLQSFNDFILNKCQLSLNQEGGEIKGQESSGILQSSTNGEMISVELADGFVQIPHGFVEFVWRFPKLSTLKPKKWEDYFTGFVAKHADHVIESLTSP